MKMFFFKKIYADLCRLSSNENSKASVIFYVFSPRFYPVFIYRLSFALNAIYLSPLAKILSWLNFILFGIEISSRCKIGKGLLIPHPCGVVIGARSIGSNATIFQGVTVGAKSLDIGYNMNKRPRLGDNVILGSGAKILGGIDVGSGAVVGANAVVTNNVEAGQVVVGIPARVLR